MEVKLSVISSKLFVIYAHWGVYSVPAYGNEWYARRMYDKQDRLGVCDYHRNKYGDQSTFGHKEFIPMFKVENYDPDEWADLIEKSGAKYAGIAVVHDDGFGLWDSDVSRWNAGRMGPKRDLCGDLVKALRRKQGMKVIATFHHIRTFDWFLPGSPEAVQEGRKAGWDLFDPEYADFYWNRYTGKFQEDDSQDIVLSVLSYYLNKSEQWGKQVDVLNKLPTSMRFNFPRQFGVLTFEEGRDRPARCATKTMMPSHPRSFPVVHHL